MTRSLLCLAAIATLTLGATAAFAGSTGKTRTQPDATATTQTTTVDRRASNWPGLPERQAGKPYRQIIASPFGFRERNFESGRR